MRIAGCLLVLVCALALMQGCGGGNSGGTNVPVANVRFSVDWGARSRAVAGPASALSAVLTLANAGPSGGDFTYTVNRDAAPAAYTGVYTSNMFAKVGVWPMAVRFFAMADGAGAVVGIAQTTANVQATSTSIATVATTGTIATVEVTPNQVVNIGETKDISFTAKDASMNVVAVTQGSATFTTSDASVLQIVNGRAKGIVAGIVTVTVTLDGVTSPGAHVTVPAATTAGYTVTNLGTLGGAYTVGFGLNGPGQVVGITRLANNQPRPFLWQNGVMTELPIVPGGQFDAQEADDINDAGVIVGRSGPDVSGAGSLVIWQSGMIRTIGTTTGDFGRNRARINRQGQVAFTNFTGRYLWDNGTTTPISAESGEVALNNQGAVAFTLLDSAGLSVPQHAVVWHGGTIQPLEDATHSSLVHGINDGGQVVGGSLFTAAFTAAVWQNGAVSSLPLLPGFAEGEAFAINSAGDAVGRCWTPLDLDSARIVSSAALWKNGVVVDLRTAIDPGTIPDGNLEAVSINDSGQLLVVVNYNSGLLVPSPPVQTFLLTPKH